MPCPGPGSEFTRGPREETVSKFPFVLLVVLHVITSLGQRPGITKRQDYIESIVHGLACGVGCRNQFVAPRRTGKDVLTQRGFVRVVAVSLFFEPRHPLRQLELPPTQLTSSR